MNNNCLQFLKLILKKNTLLRVLQIYECLNISLYGTSIEFGAVDNKDARIAARSIASSILVKSMVHGRDPNWGRIMMALGKSGVEMEESKVDIYINEIHVVHDGVAISYLKDAVISVMSGEDIHFRVNLNCGNFEATAWGCDLTEDYVVINSAYTT